MPSEFSISEVPIGDTLSGAAIFGPSFQFTETDVKYRYGERYTSEATNRKFLGVPLGVYLGFDPSFSNRVLTLSADSNFGYSLARIASKDDPLYVVDVILEEDVTLDFSNHNVFPVNVILKVTGRLGFPHSAEIVTQSAAASYPTEVLIGVVTGPDTIDVAEPFNRSTPFAYTGAPLGYGFMRGGAVEDLLNIISITAEVTAARTDLAGTTHPDLDTRLEAEADPTAMAQRLGKEIITLPGGDFTLAGPATSLNISRAFSALHRNLDGLDPVEDFDSFASETREGVITSGNVPEPQPAGALTDPERNVCAVIDATTEARLLDDERQVAYGRLVYSEFDLNGTEIVFNVGSTTVNGTGTFFTSQVEPGDIIQDPVGGDFYEVDTITTDDVLDITVAFANPTTPPSTPPTVRRRFTLDFVTRSGPDSEAEFTAPASTIRVFFNAWRSIAEAQYNSNAELLRNFEAPPIPDATTTTLGKSINVSGLTEAKAGGIYAVRENPPADQVGENHVHSIDFDGGATDAGGGVVDVTMRGPTGPDGEEGSGGTPGPDGPQGPQGQGFDNLLEANLFVEGDLESHFLIGPGVPYSLNTTLIGGNKVLFLTGGMCEWYADANVQDSNDYFDITNIRVVSGTEVSLDARTPLGGNAVGQFRFYINASVTTV